MICPKYITSQTRQIGIQRNKKFVYICTPVHSPRWDATLFTFYVWFYFIISDVSIHIWPVKHESSKRVSVSYLIVSQPLCVLSRMSLALALVTLHRLSWLMDTSRSPDLIRPSRCISPSGSSSRTRHPLSFQANASTAIPVKWKWSWHYHYQLLPWLGSAL